MLRFTPYIWKTLWRHRARTLLTVSGSAVALFVFCFVGAMHEGMYDLQRRSQSQRVLIAFQANKFCPATSHLPRDYEHAIRGIPGVREVVPIQVFTNNCRASLDVVVFYGLPAQQLRQVRDFQLLAGNWEEFSRRQDAAMVGSAVARRRRLGVGDTFSIGDLTTTIAGIYDSHDAAEENYIYTHLDFLQRSKSFNRVGTVTQLEIRLDAGVDLVTTCQRIDDTFRDSAVPTNTRPKGVFQAHSLGDLVQLIALTHYLGYACVGLVLVLVATTTIMSVQDRVREHAVLQTVGYSGWRVGTLILTESVCLSLAGGLLGVIVAGLVLHFNSLAVGAEGVMLAFRPTIRLAASGIGVSLLAGLLAGLVPAVQGAYMEIVPALRRGAAG